MTDDSVVPNISSLNPESAVLNLLILAKGVVNIRSLSKLLTSSDEITLRECWVKFEKLTPEQEAKLKEFIETHTVGEA